MEPWVWAIIVPVALALIGAVWTYVRREADRLERRLDEHIREDTKVHQQTAVNSAVNAADIKRIKEDIGDHNSGIRGWLHELSSHVTPRALRRDQRRMKREQGREKE